MLMLIRSRKPKRRGKMQRAAAKACKVCCGTGGSGGSVEQPPTTPTNCRCAYFWEYNEADPQPPPQPAGGYFPEEIDFSVDVSGDCSGCYFTNSDQCTSPPSSISPNCTADTVTVTSYCSGTKTIRMTYCPDESFLCGGGALLYVGEIPLCDLTVTFSDGTVATFRKHLEVNICLRCSSCYTMDASFLAENGWPAEWEGLEYCEPSSATVQLAESWMLYSVSYHSPVVLIRYEPDASGAGGFLTGCETGLCSFGSYPARGACRNTWHSQAHIELHRDSGRLFCTDLHIYSAEGWTGDVAMSCQAVNEFTSTLTGSCCAYSNFRFTTL